MRKLNFKLLTILGISLAMTASVFTACEPEDINPTTPIVENPLVEQPVEDSIIGMDSALISAIEINDNLKRILDSLFSRTNNVTNNISRDSIYLINNEQEFQIIGGDNNVLGIDFNQYTIIWGIIEVEHSGFEIIYQSLYNYNNEYIYNVTVFNHSSGWTVITPLYFWNIYPKIEQCVSLSVITTT